MGGDSQHNNIVSCIIACIDNAAASGSVVIEFGTEVVNNGWSC